MRGGSRSGMACAFVRFQTKEMAQSAIENIHGKVTLTGATEPLVVRWADAPGSRKRDNHPHQRSGHSRRGSGGGDHGGGGGGGSRPRGGQGGNCNLNSHGNVPGYMQQQHAAYDFSHMQQMSAMQQMPYSAYYAPEYGGGGTPVGFMPQQQMAMMAYAQQRGFQQQGHMMMMQQQQQQQQQMLMNQMQQNQMLSMQQMGNLNERQAMQQQQQQQQQPYYPNVRSPEQQYSGASQRSAQLEHGTMPPPEEAPPAACAEGLVGV